MQEYSTIWGAERMSVGMRRALGVAALIDAALGLGSTISVAAMSAGSRIVLPAVWVSPGSPAFYIRAALSLVVLFGLWRLARPGIGSHLILTGVILETVWSLAVAGAVLFAPTSSAPVQSAFTALIPYLNWIGSLVYLLIGVGLLVGTDLPRWVPWLAIFSAFAAVTSTMLPNGWSPVPGASIQPGLALLGVAVVLKTVFSAMLGVVLLVQSPDAEHTSNMRIEQNAVS